MQKHMVNYKVVLLGASTVGKTSITGRILRDEFQYTTNSTIGAAYGSKQILNKIGNIVKMDIWDTAGQERYDSLSEFYFRGGDIFILVYDLSDENTLNKVYTYMKKIMRTEYDYDCIFIGNKLDLVEKSEAERVQKKLINKIEKFNLPSSPTYIVMSALSREGFDELMKCLANCCQAERHNKTFDNSAVKLDNKENWDFTNYCGC